MRGKKAKFIRKLAGYRPGTTVRYMREKETGNLRCAGPRGIYKRMKAEDKRRTV